MIVIETLITLLIFMCGYIIVPTLRDTRSALSELSELKEEATSFVKTKVYELSQRGIDAHCYYGIRIGVEDDE